MKKADQDFFAKKLYWPLVLNAAPLDSHDKNLPAATTLRDNLPSFFTSISSLSKLRETASRAVECALGGIVLYEMGAEKSIDARAAINPNRFFLDGLNLLNQEFPDLFTVVDLCVCQYTLDGHCRIQSNLPEADTATAHNMLDQALLYAAHGASGIMPSGMLPHFSALLRKTLNESGYHETRIISQPSKFCSSLYRPFRTSVVTRPYIDKSSYQIAHNDIGSALGALLEDAHAGVDCVLIKPAIQYLDVLEEAAQSTTLPIGAFITSGEHALLLELSRLSSDPLEALGSAIEGLEKAGASIIVTYLAPDLAVRHGRAVPSHSAVQLPNFSRRVEDFKCERCGTNVIGNGYTNHCPECLWSKHVDINPGDRQELCHGLMEPIYLEAKRAGGFEKSRLLHRCIRCSSERWNKTSSNDSFDSLLRIYSSNRSLGT